MEIMRGSQKTSTVLVEIVQKIYKIYIKHKESEFIIYACLPPTFIERCQLSPLIFCESLIISTYFLVTSDVSTLLKFVLMNSWAS